MDHSLSRFVAKQRSHRSIDWIDRRTLGARAAIEIPPRCLSEASQHRIHDPRSISSRSWVPPSSLRRCVEQRTLARARTWLAVLGQALFAALQRQPLRVSRSTAPTPCRDEPPRRWTRSPAMTERASRYLSSTEKTEGRSTCGSLHAEPDTSHDARFRETEHKSSPSCSPRSTSSSSPCSRQGANPHQSHPPSPAASDPITRGASLGVRRLGEGPKREIRRGFWAALEELGE